MGEQKTSQSTAEIPMYTSAFHIQLVCPLTRMARLMLFLFSLGLTAAQPAQEGSGSLKRENPNPLESRGAAGGKDAGSDAGAPEGPVTDVGKTGNLETTWQAMRTQTANGLSSSGRHPKDGQRGRKRGIIIISLMPVATISGCFNGRTRTGVHASHMR